MADLVDMHLFRELIVSSGSGVALASHGKGKQSVLTVSCDVRFRLSDRFFGTST